MKSYLMGTVKALDDSEDPNGSFEVILSAPTLDRDGEIVDAKIFEPLPDHITFDIDHGMSVSTTVGSGVPRYDGDLLKVKGTFSSIPRAQEARMLVREGHIRTTSVAFMNPTREKGKDGKTHIVKAELLNGAFVPIPSNRESVVLSAKDFTEKVGARNSAKDAERMQQIHDLATENGATCSGKASRGALWKMRAFRQGGRPKVGEPTQFHADELWAPDQASIKAPDQASIKAPDAEPLAAAVREAHGEEAELVDFGDDWLVYSLGEELFRQAHSDGVLSGEPEPVEARVTYQPKDTDGQSSAAPVTPADEAGKSPASGIQSEYVRARAALAALTY